MKGKDLPSLTYSIMKLSRNVFASGAILLLHQTAHHNQARSNLPQGHMDKPTLVRKWQEASTLSWITTPKNLEKSSISRILAVPRG